ncbi:MAG TPA: hypothetical protein VHC22_27780 [Pirellulales bacterium]|nr:hypothetical protein [Pirellulales bacterium]
MGRSPTQFVEKKSTSQTGTWVPTPDEIRRRAAEIRRSWSPEVRRQREVPIPGWTLLPLLISGGRVLAAPAAVHNRGLRGR